MRLVRVCLLLRRRTRLDSTRPSVEAGVVDRCVVHYYGLVVDIRHIRHADIRDAAVVVEPSATPFATDEAHSAVAKTVVNAAIEADMRPPIAGMPRVESTAPSPVTGSPKHADRGYYPRAGDPVVPALVIPGPIARRPHVTGAGANGLRVHGQSGRPDAHRYPHGDLPERRGRKRHYDHTQQHPAKRRSFHIFIDLPENRLQAERQNGSS